jgi:hypothetical protein
MKRVAGVRPLAGSLLLVAAAQLGCGGSPMMRAARQGDIAGLRGAIAAAEARGRVASGDVADAARAVVAHEILHAPTPEYAAARMRDARACAFEVDGALAARATADDASAGEAALERVETGAIGDRAARRTAASVDDRWRAAGVWGLTRDEDRDARLRALVDGSPLVRRAALRAIVERDDPADEDALVEAARLDPDPLVRAAAVRAASRLAGTPADIANRLRDLWTAGDDPLRQQVAVAFASPAVLRNGGREALAHLLAVSSGDDAVTVAGVVLGSSLDDPELRAAAMGQLVFALAEGGERARIHAIAVAPLGGLAKPRPGEASRLLEALRKASKDEDADVRMAALGRLADARAGAPADDRAAAIQALEALAAPDQTPAVRGSRARLLLAEAGDLRVQAWVEADLRSTESATRLGAADALAALGRASRAARLLADDDPSVRTRAACTILLASRLGHAAPAPR